MNKIIKLILPLLAVIQLANATPQEAFAGYKSSILEQQGSKAASVVTSSTIEEYQKYVDAAKYAEKDEMEKLSFLTRFQALIIRHRIPRSELEGMNGKEVFIYAVDNDWIGKTGVVPMEIGNVNESGNRAVSDAIHNGQRLPFKFTYKKEEGEWKFDLTQILMNTEAPLRMAAKQAQMEENQFIFVMLETVSGNKPDESLWTPPFQKRGFKTEVQRQ